MLNIITVIIVVLPAPTNVTTGVVTSTSVEITWDKSDGATGYHISCVTTASLSGNKSVTVTGGDTTSCILSNLVENTPYVVTVQSLNTDNRKGDRSDEVSIKTGKYCITIIIS